MSVLTTFPDAAEVPSSLSYIMVPLFNVDIEWNAVSRLSNLII